MKTSLIIILNKIIYMIGKFFGKGSSLPGKISLKLDKNILDKVKFPKYVIVVTGSNGKTTTVEMICRVLRENGYSVGTNKEGSNQTEGATTMILNNCNLKGEAKVDAFVIESDERYARHTLKHFKANYLIVTNLYRDQSTRNGHPEIIYDIIKDAISSDVHLILNTDDPLSSLYGYKRNNVTYFGMAKNQFSRDDNISMVDDGKYCPNCKHKMKYDYYHFNHIGSYHCENCGHERKNPEFEITDFNLKDGQVEINNKYKLDISLRGIYNAYNMLSAFTVATLIGIKEENSIKVLNNYTSQNGRVEEFMINGHKVTALTTKHENVISYSQSILCAIRENKPCTIVFILDKISRKYYTNATHWIWDIDFELLKCDCVKRIVAAGKYINDLALRLEYAGIDKNIIFETEDLDKMMDDVKKNAVGDIYLITCFTDKPKFMERR